MIREATGGIKGRQSVKRYFLDFETHPALAVVGFFGLMVYLSYWLKNRWRLNTGEDFGGLAGDVVPGSNGCRKVRWTRQGMGQRGGARVIYFNEIEDRIWLLIVYSKAKLDNLPAEFLAQLQREVENG